MLRLAEVLVDAGRRATPVVARSRGGGGGLGADRHPLCHLLGESRGTTITGRFASSATTFNNGFGNFNNGSLEIFGDQFDYPVTAKGDATGVTIVVLDGLRGNVTVTGGDTITNTGVEGRKTVRAYQQRTRLTRPTSESALKFIRDGNQLLVKA